MILFEPLNPTTITVNGLGNAEGVLLFTGYGSSSFMGAAGSAIGLGSLSFNGRGYASEYVPGEGVADGDVSFSGFAAASASLVISSGNLSFAGEGYASEYVPGEGVAAGALVFGGFAAAAIAGARGDGLLAFEGAARFGSTLVPEFPVIGASDLEFSFEASTGYLRTQVNEPEGALAFDGFAAAAGLGGFARDGSLSFFGEALTTAPVFELVGAVNLFSQVYGITGFEPVLQIDDVQLSGAQYVDLSILVEQFVPVVDEQTSSMETQRTVVEELVLAERLAVIYRLLQAEGVVLGDTLSSDYNAVLRAADAVMLSGAVASYAEAYALVTAAVALGMRADPAYALQAQDGVVAGGSITELLQAANALVEALSLQSVATGAGVAALVVPEGLALDAAPQTSAELANVIRDALRLTLRFTLDSGEYAAWVINTESKALSSYRQFPVNSFAVFGGRVLGATSDGIYSLDGADDDGKPIAARVRYALTTMGTGRQKRIPEAYMGYTATGDVLVRVITTDTGEGKVAHVYRLVPSASNGAPAQGRAKFGKGTKAVYYAFELENVAGADFDFDKIEMHPLELENRTRGNGVGR